MVKLCPLLKLTNQLRVGNKIGWIVGQLIKDCVYRATLNTCFDVGQYTNWFWGSRGLDRRWRFGACIIKRHLESVDIILKRLLGFFQCDVAALD